MNHINSYHSNNPAYLTHTQQRDGDTGRHNAGVHRDSIHREDRWWQVEDAVDGSDHVQRREQTLLCWPPGCLQWVRVVEWLKNVDCCSFWFRFKLIQAIIPSDSYNFDFLINSHTQVVDKRTNLASRTHLDGIEMLTTRQHFSHRPHSSHPLQQLFTTTQARYST